MLIGYALGRLHKLGIVHRDIYSNLGEHTYIKKLNDNSFSASFIDFGIAKYGSEKEIEDEYNEVSRILLPQNVFENAYKRGHEIVLSPGISIPTESESQAMTAEEYKKSIAALAENVYARLPEWMLRNLPQPVCAFYSRHPIDEQSRGCPYTSFLLMKEMERGKHSPILVTYFKSSGFRHSFVMEKVRHSRGKVRIWVIDLSWQQFLSGEQKRSAKGVMPKVMIVEYSQLEGFLKEHGISKSKWKIWKSKLF